MGFLKNQNFSWKCELLRSGSIYVQTILAYVEDIMSYKENVDRTKHYSKAPKLAFFENTLDFKYVQWKLIQNPWKLWCEHVGFLV